MIALSVILYRICQCVGILIKCSNNSNHEGFICMMGLLCPIRKYLVASPVCLDFSETYL